MTRESSITVTVVLMLSILSGLYKLRAATGNAPYAYARSDGNLHTSQLYFSAILSYDM